MSKTIKFRLPAMIVALMLALSALLPGTQAKADLGSEIGDVINHYETVVSESNCAADIDWELNNLGDSYRTVKSYEYLAADPQAAQEIADEVQPYIDHYWRAVKSLGCATAGIAVSKAEVVAGEEIVITVSNLASYGPDPEFGEEVDILMFSDPVVLAKGKKADKHGKLSVKVKIPANTPAGKHTIKVKRADGRTANVAVITVKAAATKGSATLPTTGAASSSALFALITGSAALVALRRNRH